MLLLLHTQGGPRIDHLIAAAVTPGNCVDLDNWDEVRRLWHQRQAAQKKALNKQRCPTDQTMAMAATSHTGGR
jgi:hypothetical protein